MAVAVCKRCDAEVLWCVTESGKRVPILLDESPVGSLEPHGVTARGQMVLRSVPAGDGRYEAHVHDEDRKDDR